MIRGHETVILQNGQELTAAEIAEGLVRLAANEVTFPILSDKDRTVAVLTTAVDALEWVQMQGMLT